MNLLEFRSKLISSDIDKMRNDSFFSEEVTLFNILNGYFANTDIHNIRENYEKKNFSIDVSSEEIAVLAERNLNNQITPGAYYPLYRIGVARVGNTLKFKLNKVKI